MSSQISIEDFVKSFKYPKSSHGTISAVYVGLDGITYVRNEIEFYDSHFLRSYLQHPSRDYIELMFQSKVDDGFPLEPPSLGFIFCSPSNFDFLKRIFVRTLLGTNVELMEGKYNKDLFITQFVHEFEHRMSNERTELGIRVFMFENQTEPVELEQFKRWLTTLVFIFDDQDPKHYELVTEWLKSAIKTRGENIGLFSILLVPILTLKNPKVPRHFKEPVGSYDDMLLGKDGELERHCCYMALGRNEIHLFKSELLAFGYLSELHCNPGVSGELWEDYALLIDPRQSPNDAISSYLINITASHLRFQVGSYFPEIEKGNPLFGSDSKIMQKAKKKFKNYFEQFFNDFDGDMLSSENRRKMAAHWEKVRARYLKRLK